MPGKMMYLSTNCANQDNLKLYNWPDILSSNRCKMF